MDPIAEALKARTKRFADRVLDFVEMLPRTPAALEVARQLARAGNGVAGNYRSSCRARSHTEFTAKTGQVLDEADESELWLSVCETKKWGDHALRTELLDESSQLRAIFERSYRTARANEVRRRRSDRPQSRRAER